MGTGNEQCQPTKKAAFLIGISAELAENYPVLGWAELMSAPRVQQKQATPPEPLLGPDMADGALLLDAYGYAYQHSEGLALEPGQEDCGLLQHLTRPIRVVYTPQPDRRQ